ncbi:hypothetical protein WKW80_03490 [Variovorax humicola]|uniref:Metal-dependent hydrolase n=1 Tax=Variovorax humicola TaxID=1769758 RepID=A0ABU8VTI6_9BURK
MFIGHFAVALAAKRVTPSTSLGALFAAAQFADLLWPALLLAGLEVAEVSPQGAVIPLRFISYPYSHSLVAAALAAALLGLSWLWWSGSKRAAWVIGALVLSHWVLDLIVHVPDLPLLPVGGPRWGLGLWQRPMLALLLELALFAAGAWLYLDATEAADRVGRWGLWSLLLFLVLIQLANAWGPRPPDIAPVIWSGHATWLLVAWGWWADLHRRARSRINRG